MTRDQVHVFATSGRFGSFAALRAYIDPTYTDDGDVVLSPFMNETGLQHFEPGCVEAIFDPEPASLKSILARSSYSVYWLPRVPDLGIFDEAICAFLPNTFTHPSRCSVSFVGRFEFDRES